MNKLNNQSSRKNGTGLGSNSRPLDLQSDSLPTLTGSGALRVDTCISEENMQKPFACFEINIIIAHHHNYESSVCHFDRASLYTICC